MSCLSLDTTTFTYCPLSDIFLFLLFHFIYAHFAHKPFPLSLCCWNLPPSWKLKEVLRLCLVCFLSACVHYSAAALWPQSMTVSQWCYRRETGCWVKDFHVLSPKETKYVPLVLKHLWYKSGLIIFLENKPGSLYALNAHILKAERLQTFSVIKGLVTFFTHTHTHTHEWGEKLSARLLSWSRYKCLMPELLWMIHLIILTQ